jgi:Spy/CpxP family protein refolding chaperone
MRTAVRTLLTVALAACIISPLAAADDAKKKDKKKGGKRRTAQVVRVPKTVELTADQTKQVAAINKEFAPKFMELQKKLRGILSEDQRKARTATFKANREAKLKGKEAKKALDAALNLTDEQAKQMAEVQKELGAIRKEAGQKFFALLTPEQKKLARPARKGGKKKTDKKKTDKKVKKSE